MEACMRTWVGIVSLVLATGALVAAPPAASGAPVPSWPSAGHDLANTRSNPAETAISPATVAGLTTKWSVGFSTYLAATPAVADGLVFLADHGGNISAYDAVSG